MNKAAQVAHGSWSALGSFEGDLLALYFLSLTCHVPIVTVEMLTHDRLPKLAAALSDTSPSKLDLSVSGGHKVNEEFVRTMCAERTPQIHSLNLTVSMVACDVDLDASTIMVSDPIPPLGQIRRKKTDSFSS